MGTGKVSDEANLLWFDGRGLKPPHRWCKGTPGGLQYFGSGGRLMASEINSGNGELIIHQQSIRSTFSATLWISFNLDIKSQLTDFPVTEAELVTARESVSQDDNFFLVTCISHSWAVKWPKILERRYFGVILELLWWCSSLWKTNFQKANRMLGRMLRRESWYTAWALEPGMKLQ